MTIPNLRWVAGVAMAVSLASCGLISSDVTNFDLNLPDKKFTIDTAGWQVDKDKAGLYLMMSCSATPTVCSSAVHTACTTGCSGSCNTNPIRTCDLSLDISLSQPVNLVMEQPELKTLNDEPVIKVTVDSVTYDVMNNTLNVATPEMVVYVAPLSIVKPDPTDSQVKAIGKIASIPAGWVTEQPEQLEFTPTGRSDLVAIMSSFKTTFNVLVGSSLRVTSGQQLPTGKLEAIVHIKGHAGL